MTHSPYTLCLEFTQEELLGLAELLEGLNNPRNPDPVLRRLTDAVWGVSGGNKTERVIVTMKAEDE